MQRGGHALLITGNLLVNEEVAHPADAESEAVISLNEVNQRPVTRAMIVGNLCLARSGSGIQLRSCNDVAVEANMVVATGPCTQGIFARSQSSSVDNLSIRNNDITVEGPGSWGSSPEGQVAGNAGDIYQRLDAHAGPRLFVKESDALPKTGWIAK